MNAITDSTRGCAPDDAAYASPEAQPDWAGAPLRARLRLLALPAAFAASLFLFGWSPGTVGLYGFAAVFGLIVLADMRNGPETLLALTVMYLPLARLYAARLAPGLNGSNLLELMLVAAWIGDAARQRRPLWSAYPFTRVVGWWLVLSLVSVVTAIARIGLQPFEWSYTEALRGFLDQFLIFYLFVNMIRDRNMARRMLVYVMVSAAVVYLYGIQEWWGTRDLASIEKSRLLGTVGQPNDFAALLVYSLAPFLAWGAFHFPRWRSLRVAPVLLLGVKVLLAAFSRGAYLAFALQVLAVTFVRSRRLFALALALAAAAFVFVPSMVPESLRARVDQTYEQRVPGAEIDKSADSRLILWSAAADMALRHPLFGVGFNQFSTLVPEYVSGFYDDVTGGATDNQNMFLYAASNMGLPNLFVLGLLLLLALARGWRLCADRRRCDVDRIVGLSMVALVAGLVGVNMFGTHVIDSAVDGFFWVVLALLARLSSPEEPRARATAAPRRA